MPELPEVEAYRRLATHALGRRIVEVQAPDAWILKRGLTPEVVIDALTGRHLTSARRAGKVLLLEQGLPQTIRPMVGAMAAARIGGAPTPVEAEPIEVRASVTLTIAVE